MHNNNARSLSHFYLCSCHAHTHDAYAIKNATSACSFLFSPVFCEHRTPAALVRTSIEYSVYHKLEHFRPVAGEKMNLFRVGDRLTNGTFWNLTFGRSKIWREKNDRQFQIGYSSVYFGLFAIVKADDRTFTTKNRNSVEFWKESNVERQKSREKNTRNIAIKRMMTRCRCRITSRNNQLLVV